MIRTGEISTRAMRKVKNQGFELAESPDYKMPQLPADITEVHEQDVMILFTEVCAWLDYTEVQHVAAQIDHKQEEQKFNELEAKEQIRHKAEKHVTTIKAYTYDKPEVEHQRKEVLMAYAHVKVLETVLNSLERKRFLISREISRRQGNGHS